MQRKSLSGDTNSDFFTGITAGTWEGSTGNGGNISIKNANSLEVYNLAGIRTDSEGQGRSGNITIDATNLLLSGNRSGLFTGIDSRTYNSGNAGDITITSKTLDMRNDAGIIATTDGSGLGGNLNIHARDIIFRDDAYVAAASRTRGVNLQNNPNMGRAGNIFIKADNFLKLSGDSWISVATAEANAGSITLDIGKLLYLGDTSLISTSAAIFNNLSFSNGGNINIFNPTFTVLQGGSQIKAQAKRGHGGNITLATDYLFKSPDSLISASSEFGQSGTVNVNTPDSQIINSTLKLSDKLLNASSLLSERCAARAYQDKKSSLRVKTRSLRPGPEEWATSRITQTARTAHKLKLKNANIAINWPLVTENEMTAPLDCRWQIAKH